MADYVIASVAETLIMDVFPFDASKIPAEKEEPKSEEELIAEQKSK
jgi:hypothetical protein